MDCDVGSFFIYLWITVLMVSLIVGFLSLANKILVLKTRIDAMERWYFGKYVESKEVE